MLVTLRHISSNSGSGIRLILKISEVCSLAKKSYLIAIVLVVLAGVGFMLMRRSQMMGSTSQDAAKGLVAVSVDGTPVSVPEAQAAAGKLPENTAMQESGGLLISLALNPYPPSVAKAGNFDVTLTDTSGQAISDATISLDLTMPQMPMPLNQLNMELTSDGKYHATGRFTMGGWWRIEVIITRGDQQQSVFFDIIL